MDNYYETGEEGFGEKMNERGDIIIGEIVADTENVMIGEMMKHETCRLIYSKFVALK